MIALLALVAALIATVPNGGEATQRFIPLMQTGDALPPIPLLAQNGRPFRFADWHREAIAVAFIYTRCRDPRMCPLVAAKFAQAQREIGTAPIRLVLLTLDPAHDTPPVLARYGKNLGQNPRYWTLATGSQLALSELAGRFGIATAANAPGSIVPGSIVHTEAAIIIGPDGRIARTIDGNAWSPRDLIDAARATFPGQDDVRIAVRAWLSAALERCGRGGVAPGGTAMLVILAAALLLVGGAFWYAFRTPAVVRAAEARQSPPTQNGG